VHRRRRQSQRVRLLGRLPALIALVLCACEPTSSAPPPSRRSESITTDAAPAASAPVGASAAHSASAPARKLCEIELGRVPRRFPKGTFTPVAAAGAEKSADPGITPRAGRWTWINFFAAWCGPCKEEMPRLRDFQQRLASALDVTFVSLDDDGRQLDKFLGEQPANGVKSALWLEPKSRKSWLGALDMKESPDLPAHILVDRAGKVRCIFEGAVTEADFPTIKAIVERTN
jgi:thiol-disulfide isomerase/thioredoxin